MTYNHEDYIADCLESVVSQIGDFKKLIVICDDCSTDDTNLKIQEFIDLTETSDNLQITYTRNDHNIGLAKNLKQLIKLLKNSDYFTFCEGDDYYLSEKRIKKHLELHKVNPQLIMSFNKYLIYYQEQDLFEYFNPAIKNNLVTTEILAANNVIGNFSCCFYNSKVLEHVKDDLFDFFIADWMFNIVVSQFGGIAVIKEPLSVYRKHDRGVWAGVSEDRNRLKMLGYIDKYNQYLNYTYDQYFYEYRNRVVVNTSGVNTEKVDLAIIDDIFPHPMSGFRYQEFHSILNVIPNSKIFSNGASAHCLGTTTIEELLISYKRKFPDMGSRVQTYNHQFPLNAKLIYCVFLQNAYYYVVSSAEEWGIPFIFTLYPGGGFSLGTEEGDMKLKRVLQSPYFKKVIVTQKITYDYLINKHLCKKEDIEYIFGIVMPLDKIALNIKNKLHYGFGKKTLDICFVANKYTPQGEDKGYDVFIETARHLCKKFNDIYFHVVGPWDSSIINITGISHISFYGIQGQDWFDEFYIDKDIIISPNIDGKIFAGCFDGFPTGCLTDAALRKVAMFGTDPLNLNDSYFEDKREIVIIKNNVSDIAEKVEYYYKNPDELKELCENGYKKVKNLYCYERQVAPRIDLLKNALAENFIPKDTIPEGPKKPTPPGLFRKVIKKIVPWKIRRMYHLTNNKIKRILYLLRTA